MYTLSKRASTLHPYATGGWTNVKTQALLKFVCCSAAVEPAAASNGSTAAETAELSRSNRSSSSRITNGCSCKSKISTQAAAAAAAAAVAAAAAGCTAAAEEFV